MSHLYSDFIFCKNNFFQKPDRITDFANSLEFSYKHKGFPGTRTANLALSDNPECKDFANFFVAKLLNEVYTNILEATIDLRFHKYPVYDDNDLNTGWTHIDDSDLLAGVDYETAVYLTTQPLVVDYVKEVYKQMSPFNTQESQEPIKISCLVQLASKATTDNLPSLTFCCNTLMIERTSG